MRKGNIVFVQGKGIISKIIRYFDGNGMFSHVAIAIGRHRVIEADIDTKVNIRDFNKDKYKKIEVLDLELTEEQIDNVMIQAIDMIGTRYDYLQLIWYVLRKMFNLKGKNKLNSPKNVICSELVYIVLNESGILSDLGISHTFKNGTDLTPNELYDLVKYLSK